MAAAIDTIAGPVRLADPRAMICRALLLCIDLEEEWSDAGPSHRLRRYSLALSPPAELDEDRWRLVRFIDAIWRDDDRAGPTAKEMTHAEHRIAIHYASYIAACAYGAEVLWARSLLHVEDR